MDNLKFYLASDVTVCFLCVLQALRKVSQDQLILLLCTAVFLSYLPEAGEYSSIFVYLKLVSAHSHSLVLALFLPYSLFLSLGLICLCMYVGVSSLLFLSLGLICLCVYGFSPYHFLSVGLICVCVCVCVCGVCVCVCVSFSPVFISFLRVLSVCVLMGVSLLSPLPLSGSDLSVCMYVGLSPHHFLSLGLICMFVFLSSVHFLSQGLTCLCVCVYVGLSLLSTSTLLV